MDLQPSGNNEVLFIETDAIYFSIKATNDSVGYGKEKSLCAYSKNKEIELAEYYNLYFKEYKNYELIIESKNSTNISFHHENETIRNKITPTGRSRRMYSGIINFRGDIGYSDLYIYVDGKENLKIKLEVLPSKIDYKEDYYALLNDVNEEIYNLAYGFLSRTYLGAEINNKVSGSYTEFYSILNYLYERLIKAINIVLQNPHHGLIKDSSVKKYHGLKNCSNDTTKWLEKRPHLLHNINGSYIPSEAIQVTKKLTTDTNENRFLKFMLLRIVNKIEAFLLNYRKSQLRKDEVIINKLEAMKREIVRKINTTFLREVSNISINTSISLVFSMASGYREIYKYYLMLQKGLTINNNIMSLSMKELSLLYEYWCFIKINSLLRKKYNLISADFMKINKDGIAVSLKKGISSTLIYENTKTKEKFKVAYNSSKLSKTINQKPDNILSLNKDGNITTYEFIFDAKYKVDFSEEYKRRYGGVGPREEDINTMHRYRDAIVYENKKNGSYENCIFGAFVLFPYKEEEEYRNNRFYNSIEEVNIGGIPFLPSTTKLMEEFLDNLINESSYSTFERALEASGKEYYLKDEYFNNRNVLVGSLRNKEQLQANLQGNFYHTKCSNVNLAEHNIKFIALAQSKNTFKEDAGITYYGKVKDIKQVKRCDISELPSNSEDLYYRFEIEQWEPLKEKIKVEGYQVLRVMYTTEYLLKSANTVTELCIKTKEEYRLWKELKRINDEVLCIENKMDGRDILVFRIDDIEVIVKQGSVKFIKGNEVVICNINRFIRNPRSVISDFFKPNITLKKGSNK